MLASSDTMYNTKRGEQDRSHGRLYMNALKQRSPAHTSFKLDGTHEWFV